MAKRQPISKKLRYEILARDGFTCQYCGRQAPEVKLEIDHRVPISRGGVNWTLNLVTACVDCNRGKSKSGPAYSFRDGFRPWYFHVANDADAYSVLRAIADPAMVDEPTVAAAYEILLEWFKKRAGSDLHEFWSRGKDGQN